MIYTTYIFGEESLNYQGINKWTEQYQYVDRLHAAFKHFCCKPQFHYSFHFRSYSSLILIHGLIYKILQVEFQEFFKKIMVYFKLHSTVIDKVL